MTILLVNTAILSVDITVSLAAMIVQLVLAQGRKWLFQLIK